MGKIDVIIRKIKDEQIGRTGKRLLLVEGSDDVAAYRIFVGKKTGNQLWEQSWLLHPAGNKKILLEILAIEPTWIGLVDRDEWGDSAIAEKQRELPGLVVLPRFCMENYLIDPAELWDAFPQVQKDKIQGGLDELSTTILRDQAKWLRHGVLWSVINPLWSGLRALGFKDALLEDVEKVQDDAAIQQTLSDWHEFLQPVKIFEEFQSRHAEVAAKSVPEQLHRWVHGKSFYQNVVHPALDRLLGQKSANERRRSILQSRALPGDLAPLWAKMGY